MTREGLPDCIAPLLTHFLQQYFGLTPRPETADLSELPALKFRFLPLYERTVICKDDPFTLLFEGERV